MTVSESTHISEVLRAAVPRNEGQRSLENLLEELRAQESLENPDVTVPMKELRLTSDGRLAVPALDRQGVHATVAIAPDWMPVANPAFDVTPARLIAGIVTERGVCAPGELHTLFGNET